MFASTVTISAELSSTMVSIQWSSSLPMARIKSAFDTSIISEGVVSYVWGESPGSITRVTLPLSPTICLAISYTGKIVADMFSFSVSVADSLTVVVCSLT
ncbi:MAG: Uncharacterised protein [Chloroflexota bacterium]|nr:MAG: Uncharacterised protein [Chloroflexota bacterium]